MLQMWFTPSLFMKKYHGAHRGTEAGCNIGLFVFSMLLLFQHPRDVILSCNIFVCNSVLSTLEDNCYPPQSFTFYINKCFHNFNKMIWNFLLQFIFCFGRSQIISNQLMKKTSGAQERKVEEDKVNDTIVSRKSQGRTVDWNHILHFHMGRYLGKWLQKRENFSSSLPEVLHKTIPIVYKTGTL